MTLFPYCGISNQDIEDCITAKLNMRQSAKRLGISESRFYPVMKAAGWNTRFARRTRKAYTPNPKYPGKRLKLTKRRLLYYARLGYTIKDTAFAVGACYKATRLTINYYGIRDLFPSRIEGRWIAQRGYAQ